MKAVCIVGMPNGFYGKAARIIGAVNGALGELGLSVTQMSLLECYLPYYDEGIIHEGFTRIAGAVKDSKNIVLAYNATDGSPSAVMKVFLEYLTDKKNRSLFENKNIMNIALSLDGGERAAADYVGALFDSIGAYELTRLCVGGDILSAVLSGAFPIDSIEKYAEDYYRLIRQNRVFLRSSTYSSAKPAKPAVIERLPAEDFQNIKAQVETSMKKTLKSAITPEAPSRAKDIMETGDKGGFGNEFFMSYVTEMDKPEQNAQPREFDVFDSRQEEDIEELTKLFATKLKADDAPQAEPPAVERARTAYIQQNDFTDAINKAPLAQNRPIRPEPLAEPIFADIVQKAQNEIDSTVVPRNKTCRQMTASLPHYFQAQLSQDTEAVFQLNIFGEEEFSGYLLIKNRDNEYYDGQYESPDITIISSAPVWQTVLRGKITAQKAFMTGQLKVRGNFMLLNRFDQLYKKMS